MKYKVTITKVAQSTVEIDAQSAEEAKEKAAFMLDECEITLDTAFWPDGLEYHVEAVEND